MRRLVLSVLFAVLAALAVARPAAAGERPVVVELFTSQGCSSCPPAEALLRDLAGRDDVIALEFHVDYWDYIGWKDIFAKPAFTERQEGYVHSFRGRYKYTPQMVIGGAAHVVGSNRSGVEAEIARQKQRAIAAPRIEMRTEGGAIVAEIGAAEADGAYDIVFVAYDREHRTEVRRGENSGRTLINARVVRDYEMLGRWTGEPKTVRLPADGLTGEGGCAVLVQKQDYGEIVAAAAMPFGESSR